MNEQELNEMHWKEKDLKVVHDEIWTTMINLSQEGITWKTIVLVLENTIEKIKGLDF